MATDDDTVTDVIFFSRRLTLGNLARAFREIGKALFVAQVAIDTYHIGKTIYTECTKTKKKCPGKRTLKRTKMVAAGWTGSTVGSTVGTGIGAAFGGFWGTAWCSYWRNVRIVRRGSFREENCGQVCVTRNMLFAPFFLNRVTVSNFRVPGLVL